MLPMLIPFCLNRIRANCLVYQQTVLCGEGIWSDWPDELATAFQMGSVGRWNAFLPAVGVVEWGGASVPWSWIPLDQDSWWVNERIWRILKVRGGCAPSRSESRRCCHCGFWEQNAIRNISVWVSQYFVKDRDEVYNWCFKVSTLLCLSAKRKASRS